MRLSTCCPQGPKTVTSYRHRNRWSQLVAALSLSLSLSTVFSFSIFDWGAVAPQSLWWLPCSVSVLCGRGAVQTPLTQSSDPARANRQYPRQLSDRAGGWEPTQVVGHTATIFYIWSKMSSAETGNAKQLNCKFGPISRNGGSAKRAVAGDF